MWYVYFVEKGGRYYAGITTDLARRIRKHGVHRAMYYERHESKSEATKKERQVKGWIRTEKERLWNIVGG
jgi:predicted GIY-YIG superfamily endonuclease